MNSRNKSQTVATIDVHLHWNQREKFLEEHAHCPLCGLEMLITHVTQFVGQTVKEEAFCEKCNVRVRDNQHTLQ